MMAVVVASFFIFKIFEFSAIYFSGDKLQKRDIETFIKQTIFLKQSIVILGPEEAHNGHRLNTIADFWQMGIIIQ